MKRPQLDRGAMWTLEEAAGVLREIPARSWTLWLAGTLPFVWALVDFLMEMSSSAYAEERLIGKSLIVTLLFLAKHCVHAIFSRDCLQVLRGAGRITWPGLAPVVRLCFVQAALQPLRFVVLPIASFFLIPFPWCAAFFRNVGLSALEQPRGFVKDAWRLGRGDSAQHTVALLVLTLSWLLLFLNLLVLWFVVPMLLKAFFGWETDLSRLANRLLNGNTVLVTAVLTFTALEPVICSMAAVRAFYAKAQSSGEDLRGSLRRLAAAVLFCLLWIPAAAHAQGAPEQQIDRTLDDVLRDPEFAWRLPRPDKEGADGYWLESFFRNLSKWIEWLLRFMEDLFPKPSLPGGADDATWNIDPALLRMAMIGAAVLAAGAIIMILMSRRGARKTKSAAAAATPVAVPKVDLADDSISAEQHAEDEWLRMADECAARGEFRLGMRALHLAGLRYLGEKGWITLQQAKTGLEYAYELQRRLKSVPAAVDGYSAGLRQYEVVWYGFGNANPESYLALRGTWEELRRHA